MKRQEIDPNFIIRVAAAGDPYRMLPKLLEAGGKPWYMDRTKVKAYRKKRKARAALRKAGRRNRAQRGQNLLTGSR